ncbi:MAG: hypothetical protein DME18_11140 [Verrucomicrobia bacterium]|nr:MAG: hypothetical protein DME18_11140 [Verrucomicrobiota bacterium]
METAAMPGLLGLSGGEWVLLIVIFAILFSTTRIPPFARGLGQGIERFCRASRECGRELGESLGAGLGKPVADALTHANQIPGPARAATAANQEASEKPFHPMDRPGVRRRSDFVCSGHVWLAPRAALVRCFAVAGEFLALHGRNNRRNFFVRRALWRGGKDLEATGSGFSRAG